MGFKVKEYKNYIICVKMFMPVTKETLIILPKKDYRRKKYRIFGQADTYEEALKLKDAAYQRFLKLKNN